MNEFGNLLRNFRELCHDPIFPARKLTQLKFGELLGKELGAQGYSGAAVSDWERGKSKIHADDRLVLISLIKTLHKYEGLKTLEQANQLLETGNYRALDPSETQKIFGEISSDTKAEEHPAEESKSKSSIRFLTEELFTISEGELQTIISEAKDGPPPSWPRVLAALMRRLTDRVSISITAIIWVAVWISAFWLIGPSLRLPFTNRGSAMLAIGMYVCGSLVIPLFIGALINTKTNEYWKEQNQVSPFLLRLYTYQGAGIGFNLGYFFVLPFSLARYYLHLEPTVWLEIMATTLGLILGNMGGRVVSHNLWRTYGRLTFKDGGIFFVVALIGPMWGFFFLEYYDILLTPTLGVFIILSAIALIVVFTARQSRRKAKENQPDG